MERAIGANPITLGAASAAILVLVMTLAAVSLVLAGGAPRTHAGREDGHAEERGCEVGVDAGGDPLNRGPAGVDVVAGAFHDQQVGGWPRWRSGR